MAAAAANWTAQPQSTEAIPNTHKVMDDQGDLVGLYSQAMEPIVFESECRSKRITSLPLVGQLTAYDPRQ